MKNRKLIAALAFAGLTISAGAQAAGFYAIASDRQIQQCVTEIGNQADYSGAARVEHNVLSEERRTVGYILTIDTTIYSETEGDVIREYATKCVVAAGEEPLRFTIRQLGN